MRWLQKNAGLCGSKCPLLVKSIRYYGGKLPSGGGGVYAVMLKAYRKGQA